MSAFSFLSRTLSTDDTCPWLTFLYYPRAPAIIGVCIRSIFQCLPVIHCLPCFIVPIERYLLLNDMLKRLYSLRIDLIQGIYILQDFIEIFFLFFRLVIC